MVTEGQVTGVVIYLASAYPRTEIPETTMAVYVMQLMRARPAFDALLLAAMNLIDASQWLPTVAELIAEARSIESQRDGWYLSANYRLYGHPLPEELCLPAGLAEMVEGLVVKTLEHWPSYLELGAGRERK